MQEIIQKIENTYKEQNLTDVRSGDTVRVTQKIKEGNKERTQVFEGLVIRTRRMDSLSATIAVRRISSGIGVEKTFLLHSPLVEKIQVIKRSRVRRNYLSYMRERSGKSARLENVGFDADSVNAKEPELDEVVAKDNTPEEPALEAVADKKSEDKPIESKEEPKEEVKTEDKKEA